ncbi:MAG: reverse transcriptase domain-containing protein, partial [Fusobacteriaceae bacterium]
FDRVNRLFMFKVMERMGFGEDFIGWIRALYTGSNFLVTVNGNVGQGFEGKGGLRQGCSLSPLLFILYMEPMAEAIRLDSRIKEFVVPGEIITVC